MTDSRGEVRADFLISSSISFWRASESRISSSRVDGLSLMAIGYNGDSMNEMIGLDVEGVNGKPKDRETEAVLTVNPKIIRTMKW